MRRVQSKACAAWLILLLCTAGCGKSGQPAEVQKLSSNMRGLAIAYGRCTSQNRGRPPRNEEQLKKFIETLGPDFLTQCNAKTVDELFISSRDNKPYVVIYGKSADIVAYEQEGVDGSRFVATTVGSTEELDAERFRQAVPNAK